MSLPDYDRPGACCGNCPHGHWSEATIIAAAKGLRMLEGDCNHPFWDTCPAALDKRKILPSDGQACKLFTQEGGET